MEIEVVSNWNTFLSDFEDKDKDAYFREEYVKLYETDAEKAVCFVAKDERGCLLFPYLRRSFEFDGRDYFDFETAYGYGGPISNTQDPDFIKEALRQFYKYCKDSNYICGFVRFHPLLENQMQFEEIGQVIFDRYTVAMDLAPVEEEIWMNQINIKNRTKIKKTISNGLEFIIDVDFEYFEQFKEIYTRTMNKLDADNFYHFEARYFDDWRQKMKDSFIGVVLWQKKVISAAIFFYSKEYGHYHLSGSDMDYRNLYPNNLMLWEAAKCLRERGVNYFHLGGGSDTSEDNSLLHFKNRFSKDRYMYHIGKVIFHPSDYERICADWEGKNPEKVSELKNRLIKYKY